MSEPKRGSGETTWIALATLASIIKDKQEVSVPGEIGRRMLEIADKLELEDINIAYTAGRYLISSSFGSAFVEEG